MTPDPASVPPPGMHARAHDDEIDLRHYLHVLWRGRFLVMGLAIVGGLVGLATVWLTPPTYEASVTLARISGLRIGDEGGGSTVLSFRALLQNRRLADQVIRQFSLDARPYGFTPESFVRDAVRVEDLDSGGMIQAKVTLAHSPDLAADVANRLSEGAVELNRQMNQAEGAAARDFIKQQLDEASVVLDQTGRQLIDQQLQAQVGALEADADAILASRRQLLTISVEIEGEKARLARAVEELTGRERLLSVPRSVDSSAALLEANRQAQLADAAAWDMRRAEQPSRPLQKPSTSDPPRSRPQEKVPTQTLVPDALNLRSEFINPVYEALDYQVAMSRTRLASLQEQEQQLRAVVHAGTARNPTLSTLYSRQVELVRLETEHELAKENYSDLSMKYEQARIQVASRTSQLEIIDPAMRPERAIAPRPLRTITTAAIIGLFSGLVLVLLLGYLAPVTTTIPAAAASSPNNRAYS
jgi:capsular polysaccharide biosynthesis protein